MSRIRATHAVAATLLAALAGAAVAQPPPPNNKEEQIRQAVARADNQLLAYATRQARSELQPWIGESHPAALVALGRILAQEKSYGEAQNRLRQAAQMRPGDPAPRLFLGEVLRYVQQEGAAAAAYQEAERLARAQVQANPQNPWAHYHLGLALQGQRRWDESANHLERARQLMGGNVLPLYQLGVTRALQEQWQPAFDLLSAAIARHPGIAYSYYYRGLVAGRVNRKDLTVNDLNRFLTMAPNAPEAPRVQQVLRAAGR